MSDILNKIISENYNFLSYVKELENMNESFDKLVQEKYKQNKTYNKSYPSHKPHMNIDDELGEMVLSYNNAYGYIAEAGNNQENTQHTPTSAKDFIAGLEGDDDSKTFLVASIIHSFDQDKIDDAIVNLQKEDSKTRKIVDLVVTEIYCKKNNITRDDVNKFENAQITAKQITSALARDQQELTKIITDVITNPNTSTPEKLIDALHGMDFVHSTANKDQGEAIESRFIDKIKQRFDIQMSDEEVEKFQDIKETWASIKSMDINGTQYIEALYNVFKTNEKTLVSVFEQVYKSVAPNDNIPVFNQNYKQKLFIQTIQSLILMINDDILKQCTLGGASTLSDKDKQDAYKRNIINIFKNKTLNVSQKEAASKKVIDKAIRNFPKDTAIVDELNKLISTQGQGAITQANTGKK